MPKPVQIFFTELTADALAAGRAFDGLATGTFRDMHGRDVTFTPEELDTYLANTQAAIAATKAESGELVGLPIDARDHDKGDGAGWIVGVQRAGNLLRLVPKWTEVGRELIGKGIRRFFSATVDTLNKVILGGTLTNWPATRDAQGKVLLRPIELAQALYELQDESLDAQTMKVRQAFYDSMGEPLEQPWIKEVFADYVIVCAGERMFRVDYSQAGEDVKFADRSAWVEVKPAYVEAMQYLPKAVRSVLYKFIGAAPAAANSPAGETIMTIKLSDLSAADRAELAKQVATQLVPAGNGEPPAELKPLAEALLTQARVEAQKEFQLQLERARRESAVAELCTRVAGGSAEAPRGIKGVKADELQKRLLALDAEAYTYFSGLLEGVVKDGLVEFTELGHGKHLDGTIELPVEVAEKLDAGVFKLADLTSPILALGDLKQYDLSKWQEKK